MSSFVQVVIFSERAELPGNSVLKSVQDFRDLQFRLSEFSSHLVFAAGQPVHVLQSVV